MRPAATIALLLMSVALAGPVAAEPVKGAVAGQVVDVSGAPVPDALVMLRRDSVGYAQSARTDALGQFGLVAPEGDYEISASAEGFSVEHRAVHVPVEASAVSFTLRPGVFTEAITVVGARVAGGAETLERIPGSVETVDRAALEGSCVLNVNEGLRKAAGLNVRDEEGFALRPNIGMPGLNPTRSSKVLLLEDGVFVTYAPYGDNATYYHPPIERFEWIEVVKGSGQIAYGPVTVGGVVNYLTPDAPAHRRGATCAVAGGNRDYFNGRAGRRHLGRTGLLAEYMHKQGDGSRENVHSARRRREPEGRVRRWRSAQTLTFKGQLLRRGLAGDVLGPDARRVGGQPAAEPVRERRVRRLARGRLAPAHAAAGPHALLTTHVYASRFSRDWWRQSSNSAQRPNDSGDPRCGGMANLLTTCGNEGRLRDYAPLRHRAAPPLRPAPVRKRPARPEWACAPTSSGRSGSSRTATRRPRARACVVEDNNRARTRPYSAFVQDRLLLGRFTLSTGVRLESVQYERTNRLANEGAGASGSTRASGNGSRGSGVTYAPSDSVNVFAGVHRGFAPPRTEDVIGNTGGVVDLDAEKSWNYELGVRSLPRPGVRLEATLFRNDYENQIVPASLAGGLGATLTNGGETLHQGLESRPALDTGTLRRSDHNVFLRAAFTALPTARFEGPRFSSVPGSTTVRVSGNRLPVRTGDAAHGRDRLHAPARAHRAGRGRARERAVRRRPELGRVVRGRTARPHPSYTIWNLALSYDLRKITLYAAAKNLTDELYLADRSRGMLPGPPRQLQAGLATRF